MAFSKRHQFKTKIDGFKVAKRCYACLDCRHSQPTTYKECPVCGSKNRQYFMSKAEFHRGMMLLTLLNAGTITKLRFQPRYDLKVNGHKICAYVADAEYYMDGDLVVEDTKPEKFMDAMAKLKIKLFEAIYGITVTIPQRKSGNRHQESHNLPLIDD